VRIRREKKIGKGDVRERENDTSKYDETQVKTGKLASGKPMISEKNNSIFESGNEEKKDHAETERSMP